MEINETTMRESLATEVRSPTLVSWGAIFAGWVVAAGVAWLFYQLGAAIGLSAVDPTTQQAGEIGRGLSIGAGIWIVLTWLVSLFVGGWYAGRMSGRFGRNNGMMHGFAVWGFTAVVSIVVGFSGLANLAQGGASLVQGVGSLTGQAAGAMGGGPGGGGMIQSLGLEAEIKQAIAQGMAQSGTMSQQEANQAINQLDAQTLTQISGRLLRGDTEGAKNLIALNTNLNRQQVDSVVNSLQAQVPKYQQQAAQAAEQASNYTAGFLWVTFISTLLALGLAIWGGAVGARAALARQARPAV